MKKSFLILMISILPMLVHGQQWILMGEDSICHAGWAEVYSLCNRNDTVYASGRFMAYGPAYTYLRHIGYYADGTWHQMNLGINNSNGAQTMILYKNRLYIGGGGIGVMTGMPWPNDQIPHTENASRWNFSTQKFEAIPSATGKYIAWNSRQHDFCVYHDTLFLSGYSGVLESNGSTVFAQNIVAYDGNDFINVGALPSYSWAIEVFNDQIYISGTWYGSIRRWNGGTGVNNYNAWDDVLYTNNYPAAYDMVVDTFNNYLYIAGCANTILDPLTNRRDTGNGVVTEVHPPTGYKTAFNLLYKNKLRVDIL